MYRVFVSHGGLLSVQEALYHRTPLVGVPLGNDQKPNILRWRHGIMGRRFPDGGLLRYRK